MIKTYEKMYYKNNELLYIHSVPMNLGKSGDFLSPRWHPHYHEYIELLYSFNSNSVVYIGGDCVSFQSGDLLVINSEVEHDLKHSIENTYYYVLKIMPNVLYNNELSVYEMKYLIPFLSNKFSIQKYFLLKNAGSQICDLFKEIANEVACEEYAYEMVVRSNALKVIFLVLRHLNRNNLVDLDTYSLTNEKAEIIKKALKCIADNYAYITEQEAAKECGLSYTYFSRVFKAVMNQSFNSYVMDYRLLESKKLLTEKALSVEQASRELGFCDASYFILKFKAKYSVTPKQYQQSYLKNKLQLK